ncbi:MAG: hypothetical protein ACUZ8E_07930 [Candidatus Anammoxibacter sp.]
MADINDNDDLKYFDDDGTELNPNFINKPDLCTTCKNDDDLNEETKCNLTRLDQSGENEFICHAYKLRS